MSRVARPIVVALAAAPFLLPLWFLISGSLRAFDAPPPQGLELVPPSPTLDAYRRLPQVVPIWTYLRNSSLVAAVAVPLTVLVASWAGFGAALLHARARRWVVIGSIVVMTIPGAAVWIARFQLYRVAGVIDSYVPLVAPALMAGSPLFVLVYAWAFTRLPRTHVEFARLEGASLWKVWRTVSMPQVKPATAAVTVLAFALHWSNFLDALLYVNNPELYPLPLGLRFLQLLNPAEFPLLLAGATIATLPAVAVFLVGQRLFLHDPLGLARGR